MVLNVHTQCVNHNMAARELGYAGLHEGSTPELVLASPHTFIVYACSQPPGNIQDTPPKKPLASLPHHAVDFFKRRAALDDLEYAVLEHSAHAASRCGCLDILAGNDFAALLHEF